MANEVGYVPLKWLDDVPGIQDGTPINANNLNRVENGVLANDALAAALAQEVMQHRRALADQEGEIKTISLTNTQAYPFNNSLTTVSLTKSRDTLNYRIFVEPQSITGGFLGSVVIKDKALNGFKISYDGSATAATLKVWIIGGMYQ